MKSIISIIFSVFISTALIGQEIQTDIWQQLKSLPEVEGTKYINPITAQFFELNEQNLKELLEQAPLELTDGFRQHTVELPIPMPDGSIEVFAIYNSPVMAPGLGARYPAITTYGGKSTTDSKANIRIDLTQKGFHAMILRLGETVFVDPITDQNTGVYQSYYKSDFYQTEPDFVCLTNHNDDIVDDLATVQTGDQLRTYRLAVATTVEYTNFHGGSVADGLAAVVTSVNRVVGVFRQEVALSLELIESNDEIIYTGVSSSDPYTNNNGGTMLGQNQSNLNNVIGSANYDFGHVFSTGGGGIASSGGICQNNQKARGVTGLGSPIGDPFDIDYVSHEMGHQLSGSHTFNGNQGSCGGGNLSNNSAYEPGSGSTIMAYAGICGAHNIQNNSDPYFHSRSFQQITNFSINQNGNSCAQLTNINNSEPTVDVGQGGFSIPFNTPFELTAVGSDADGDSLSYCWEQYDLGPAGHPNSPTGNAPLFRSFSPVESPVRTFPKTDDLVNGTTSVGEQMPDYQRTLSFRCTVRDHNEIAGGVDYGELQFFVTDDAGPFEVTTPDQVEWIAGDFKGANWNVANTDQAPVNCDFVDIYLSADGGYTWPYLLQSNVPNDGTQTFTVPGVSTNQARIKVKCSDNVFFALSPNDFSIIAPNITLNIAQEANLCTNDVLTIPLEFETDLAFDGTMELSASTDETGVELSFVTDEVSVPSIAYLLVTTNGFSGNDFDINVLASSNIGEIEQTVSINGVEGENPEQVDLFQPSNNSLAVSTSISFAWFQIDDVDHYTFEIASSPAFGTTLIERTEDITASFYNVNTSLTEGAVYYWRIIAYTDCGAGTPSEAFAFQTNSATTINNPSLTLGETPLVQQGGEYAFEIGDVLILDDNSSDEIIFTITELPTAGSLVLNGEMLGYGDTFTQADIASGALVYIQDWTIENTEDRFLFDLSDVDGGWLPNQTFPINISLNSSIEGVNFSSLVKVFPNPITADLVSFSLNEPSGSANLKVIDASGKIIYLEKLLNTQNEVNTQYWGAGIYFYIIKTKTTTTSGKLVVVK